MGQVQAQLRYPVGSIQYFVSTIFTRGEDRPWTSMYLPWIDTLKEIEIKKLTCVEHHKVSWDQNQKQEKQYDGFIFKEDGATHKSGRWFNQYPSAAYSQTSNDADFRVNQELTVEEIEALPTDKLWQDYEDVKITLARVFRGVYRLKEKGDEKESIALSEFGDKIVNLLKENFGVEVCKETRVLQGKEVPGFYKVTLRPIESVPA